MKITVYAISKNEEKFAARWVKSMAEADHICVLDTGSADGTVEILADLGVIVRREEIVPWRFDVARNRSMELIPEDTDICVCTDLDEVFRPGWRAALERAWRPGTEQLRYSYIWSFDEHGRPGTEFLQEKIHAPGVFRWVHPVHEVLERTDGAVSWPVAEAPEIVLEHHPDHGKSRGGYLRLLELSVRERPNDDRNAHYLGREYFFHGRWDDCIATLQRHLAMPTATWADERAASMRYIAKAYLQKGAADQARGWFLRSAAQAPHLREPWMDLAMLCYQQENWDGVLYFTGMALTITVRPDTYICEAEAWGPLPHDLRCQAYFRTGRTGLALEEAQKALALSPADPRLAGNVEVLSRM